MATFFELQEKNRRKTTLIVMLFLAFFVWLGLGLDLTIYFWSGSRKPVKVYSEISTGQYRETELPAVAVVPMERHRKPFTPTFTIILSAFGAVLAWWELRGAAETVLRAVHAKPLDHSTKGVGRVLYNVVEEMSIAATAKMPKVWIVPDPDPNAFAVGLKDGDYHIAATEGLLLSLTREEIQGVVAHEMAHLQNQDTRLMTALTVLVGIAALISEFVARSRVRIRACGGNDDDTKIGSLIFVLWLFSVLLAPLATNLMALLISREREFLADATAAQLTRNPGALASALEKIAAAASPTASINHASAHLCIASPSAADLTEEISWFSTHPPIKQRIKRLRSIGAAA